MKKKLSILIVDDEKINRTVLMDILEVDYIVQLSKNGVQALEIANQTLPDLILLDIIMPEMDGYEVCEKLKSNSATKNIPIIFITSKSEDEDEVKGLQLGAVDYITKPLNPAVVKARVKTHLDLKLYRDQMEKLVRERTKDLEETNIALRILFAKKDESQKKAEEKILTNVNDSILPVLKKIKLDKLSPSQKNNIDVIEYNLTHLIEPIGVDLNSKYFNLTLTEIKIADLIKEGKKTREIANLLNITIGTVKWHRDNIRVKLGIKNEKVNLRTFLYTLK